MMNDPFFRSYLNQQPSRPARPVLVQQAQRRSSPKVVSVPVHFVSSEQPQMTSSMSKESAALKIQRVLRGFLVRKSVKKIASIRTEVCEVERRINDVDVVELIRRDAKERLRVTETLMSLLFKLDSIRGVDFGVRDFRKAVIKKAIALQERVDSVVAAKHESAQIDSENVCKSTLEQVPESSAFRDEVFEDSGNLAADGDSVMKEDGETDAIKEVVKEIDENCNPVETVDECGVEESVETIPTESLTEVGKENHTLENVKGCMGVQKDEEGEGTDDNKRNGQLLEKLMDDNEKMMTLMTQIFERNEMQTRMLNSLSQRVEQLEKAFMCDKPRRKKKRHAA